MKPVPVAGAKPPVNCVGIASECPSQNATFVRPRWRKPCVPAVRETVSLGYPLAFGDRMYLLAPLEYWPSPKIAVSADLRTFAVRAGASKVIDAKMYPRPMKLVL